MTYLTHPMLLTHLTHNPFSALSSTLHSHSFVHQGPRLAVGSLSTCLQPTASAEA